LTEDIHGFPQSVQVNAGIVRWVSCNHSVACPEVADEGDSFQMQRVPVNMLNKYECSCGQRTMGGCPPTWVLDEGLTTPYCKTLGHKQKMSYHMASDLVDSCEHDSEPSVSMKGREFLEQLSKY
jgi:hypothetical protein